MISPAERPNADSPSTSPSLLVRALARDDVAWERLTHLYAPLAYRWARQAGLQPNDAEDVVQNVFVSVAAGLHHFRRSEPGESFRGWLWTISRNKVLDWFRERGRREQAAGGTTANLHIGQLVAPERMPGDENDERCRLRHRAMLLLREQFEEHVWQAFVRVVVNGDHPSDVAQDLGISVATVYRAKTRVLTRLRSDLDGI